MTRLWHYKLIPVLPKKMLVSQWRECLAIKRQWEKGTLKHRLVSYVMDHEKCYFQTYINRIVGELYNRNIKFQEKYWLELLDFCNPDNKSFKHANYPEHNSRYLKQCFYNLQEKYDRGIISPEEWFIIQETYWQIEKENGNEEKGNKIHI